MGSMPLCPLLRSAPNGAYAGRRYRERSWGETPYVEAFPTLTTQLVSGDANWSDLDNIQADDAAAAAATILAHAYAEKVTCSGFDFSGIPAGATVIGIEAYVKIKSSGEDVNCTQFTLYDVTADAALGLDKFAELPELLVDSYFDLATGNPQGLDFWDNGGDILALALADYQAAGFGLRFHLKNNDVGAQRTVTCENVRLRLYYAE